MTSVASQAGWVPDEDDQPPRPHFSNVEEFVTTFLSPHIQRNLGGTMTWCSKWWKHTEAVSRLTSLWMAWEHQRLQGATGMSVWWLHHADPHMNVLLSRDAGPFARCKPDEHRQGKDLPCTPAPPNMWMSSAFSDTGS
ncbi:DUF4913 domain-containing protein [Streptosporangium lutulentum]